MSLSLSSAFLALNILTTFCTSFVSLLVAKKLIRTENKDRESVAFAMFWLFAVPVWAFASFAVFALLFRSWSLFTTFESVIRIFVPLQITLAFYYVLIKIFGPKKMFLYLTGIFFLFTLFYLASFLRDGFTVSALGNYGADTELSGQSATLFTALLVLPFIFAVYDLFFRFFRVLSKKERFGRLFAIISFLIYGAAGFWDEMNLVSADWRIMFVRLILLTSAVMAYFCYEIPEEQTLVFQTTEEKADLNRGVF